METRLTVKGVMAELGAVGVVMRRNAFGEFRVNLKGGDEATAAYATDLDEALRTGLAMAREGNKGGPIQAYDVLQVLRGEEWLDFSTLRTEAEFRIARRCVDTNGAAFDAGPSCEYRVTRGLGDRRQVIYSRPNAFVEQETERAGERARLMLCNAIGRAIGQSLQSGEQYAVIRFVRAGVADFHAVSRKSLETHRHAAYEQASPFYSATLTDEGFVSVVNHEPPTSERGPAGEWLHCEQCEAGWVEDGDRRDCPTCGAILR